MKTFDEILKYGVEGYTFRQVIDNITDDQIREAVEEYAEQFKVRQQQVCPKCGSGKWIKEGDFCECAECMTLFKQT